MKTKNMHFAQIAITIMFFQFIASKAQAQASFSPATTFSVGSSPMAMINADFNGDGKPDLAVANFADGNLSVLLGDSYGGFISANNFTEGSYPFSIISDDFNTDGKPDLAVGNLNSNNITVLLGNGVGGFATITNFSLLDTAGSGGGGTLTSIISSDFNGDGKVDIAAANNGLNIISILLGDGTGNFGTPTNFPSTNPIFLTSADFNADGKVDIAVIHNNSTNVSVYLGNGIGGFGGASNFSVGGSTPSSAVSADFNGDGKADLAITNTGSNAVGILLGNGLGSFASPISFPAGNTPLSIISGDFNGDSKVDLAVSNTQSNNSVSAFLGNGSGIFNTATNFPVGSNPRSVICADFNGDGKTDLAVTNNGNNNVSVLLNNFLPPASPICLVTVDSSLTHNIVVWEKTNLDMTAIDSFIVFREITTNNYLHIGGISGDSLSIFEDFAANPAATGYRYKLKNKNSQGVESLFSEYHNTMYLTNSGANFSWTSYQIENNTTPVASYVIYRDDNSTGNFQTIGNTTGNQFGFTDVNYSSYPNASYYVEAVMTGGTCQATRSGFAASRSNVKHIGGNGIQQLNNSTAITISPNPANKKIFIQSTEKIKEVKCLNFLGETIDVIFENNSIDISSLSKGLYFLNIISEKGMNTAQKFVKE